MKLIKVYTIVTATDDELGGGYCSFLSKEEANAHLAEIEKNLQKRICAGVTSIYYSPLEGELDATFKAGGRKRWKIAETALI